MKFAKAIGSDEILGRVVRNSAHLFSGNAASLVLSVLQGILAARMLGPAGYGLIGIVMAYASTLNGILSFRMGELVVRYGGEYLERRQFDKAAALIKLSGIAELSVSLLAFAAVALTASLATRFMAKTTGVEWMFMLYAVGLLCNFNTETATGVLQITDTIRTRGVLNLVQAAFSGSVIAILFVWNARGSVDHKVALGVVLIAYLAAKAIFGIGLFVAAWREAAKALGPRWQQADLTAIPSLRELLGFAVSSNLSATAILVFRESEVLWVGLFLSTEAAGLYKVAYTIVSLFSVPADPLILSSYPEMNRLVVQRAWRPLQQFLKKITTLSGLYNLVLALGLVIAGRWVLGVFGEQYIVAYPAMLALVAGLGFNYSLFWNRPLLLSFGLQKFALGAILVVGLLKVFLAIPLVPRYGYFLEAALLSGFYVLSVGAIVWRGLWELRCRTLETG